MKILLINKGRFANAKAGTERVLCNMANELTKKGNKVAILIFDKFNGDAPFPLDERVKIIAVKRGRLNVFERVKRCFYRDRIARHDWDNRILDAQSAKFIEPAVLAFKPDIIICYHADSARLLLNETAIDCPIITMFHFDPITIFDKCTKATLRALECCAKVQVLMESYIPICKKYLRSDNFVHIPNVVPQFDFAPPNGQDKVIIHVGRFDKIQKRQHLLIEAFKKAERSAEGWSLELWGDNDPRNPGYYEECRALIEKYGMRDRVKFCGTTNRIIEQLRKASIFALPSKYEGFGLALTEAMSVGIASIGCKCCPAIDELIVDGVNGILCDDGVEPLAEALTELMQDEEKRRRYGRAAREHMKQYAPEIIWDKWDELIKTTVEEYRDCHTK